jgi:2-polyprenyl-3-methyl-5-hydroxy-6-metoxy-1,4-benzoquinol methylase
VTTPIQDEILDRARVTLGSSNDSIYRMIVTALGRRGISGGHLVDVGCGQGGLWPVLRHEFSAYTGVDALRYDTFPPDLTLFEVDLDAPDWPVQEEVADVVVAAETIEHLENPWAFVRRCVRLAKPGAWVIVTTPNQLSVLSLLCLLLKRRFGQFQDHLYPAHRTALLESDLHRMFAECGLEDVAVEYSCSGRMPLTDRLFPPAVSRLSPRRLSDNLLIIGRKPRT